MCFMEIPVFNANSLDHDQMPRSSASDLGLHYLPMPLLCFNSTLSKWVNVPYKCA